MAPALAADLTFSDLPDWCYDSVMAMTENGLFSGTTTPVNGVAKFSPDDSMTRAQFITVLVRYLYPDADLVAGQYWYSPYEAVARQNGLISSGDFTDTLDIPCSRQEMAYLLKNALTILGEGLNAVESSYLPDYSSISSKYQEAVKVAVGLGLITGKDTAHTFAPTENMTRAQGATVINRLIDKGARMSVASNAEADAPVTASGTTPAGDPDTASNEASKETSEQSNSSVENVPASEPASNGGNQSATPPANDGVPDASNSPVPSENVVREAIKPYEAGSYVDDATLANAGIRPRPTLDKSLTKNEAIDVLNGFVFDVYGRRFFDDGIGLNHNSGRNTAQIIKENGTWGMKITHWRKSYDSDDAYNKVLNVALEGMRYLSGDKQVASALWKVVDYMQIHNGYIPDELVESYGFTISNETSDSFDLTMNGVTIHWVVASDGVSNYLYFG